MQIYNSSISQFGYLSQKSFGLMKENAIEKLENENIGVTVELPYDYLIGQEIYNELTIAQKIKCNIDPTKRVANIVISDYVDDVDNGAYTLDGTIQNTHKYNSELSEVCLKLKPSKSFLVPINKGRAKISDLQRLDGKEIQIGDMAVKIIKPNENGLMLWTFLGNKFGFNEEKNTLTWLPHNKMVNASSMSLIINLNDKIYELNALRDKRSLRFAVLIIYGWQWYVMNQEMIGNYQNTLRYYDRKILGIYKTTPNYLRRVFLATKPVEACNALQFITARLMAQKHEIVRLYISEQNDLLTKADNDINEIRVKRRLCDKNRILNFNANRPFAVYEQDLFDVRVKYSLSEKDLCDKKYEEKILNLHWERDLSKCKSDLWCLIPKVFRIRENAIISAYTNVFIKGLEIYAKEVQLMGDNLAKLIRLLIGWNKVRFEHERLQKLGNSVKCHLCDENIDEYGLIVHCYNDLCPFFNELSNNYILNTDNIESDYHKKISENLQKLTKMIDIFEILNIDI